MGVRFGQASAFGHLTIIMVHGDEELPAKAYMPLEDAMHARHVTVHETGEVDKLRVETTGDSDVFIQAGDIVKGGKQDRVVRGDFIVSREGGSVVLPAFCVEQGRWAQRGAELEGSFSGSRSSIVGRKLKLTTTLGGSQRDVWDEVDATQERLSRRLGASVVNKISESSLNLTLENEVLSSEIARHVAALETLATSDAIGFGYAIRGEPSGLEIYGARALFRSLWPKMLRAAVTEALSEPEAPPHPVSDVRAWFARKLDELGALSPLERHRAGRVRVLAREDDSAVLVETVDEKFGRVLHRRLIPKAA